MRIRPVRFMGIPIRNESWTLYTEAAKWRRRFFALLLFVIGLVLWLIWVTR